MIDDIQREFSSAVEKIPLVVRVGFAGHRDLGAVDPTALREGIHKALVSVAAEANKVAEEAPELFEGSPRIELITGLASGADQLAADVCMDEGHTLVPVSPFSWDEFARSADERTVDVRRDFAEGVAGLGLDDTAVGLGGGAPEPELAPDHELAPEPELAPDHNAPDAGRETKRAPGGGAGQGDTPTEA